jgi:hypothetical protein
MFLNCSFHNGNSFRTIRHWVRLGYVRIGLKAIGEFVKCLVIIAVSQQVSS